jgi:hypothetical protein
VRIPLSLLAAILVVPFCASADLIIDTLPGTIDFADGGISNCSDVAATASVAGFGVSTNGAACFPYSAGWSFADNGQWDPPFAVIADNSGYTTITINLEGLYSSVWGLIDYGLGCGPDSCSIFGNDPTIAVLDSKGNVIESRDINGYIFGSTDEFDFDAGRVLGFSESTPEIAYFQIGGDFIGMADISLAGAATIPEPSTIVLAGLALFIMGWLGSGKAKELARDGARS